MPLTTVATVLTSVKTATDIAKLIKNSTTSLEEAEIKLKFAELISTLADVKIEVAEIQTLLITKDEEIKKLNNEKNLAQNITYKERCYWTTNGETEDGPYCQKCYDVDKKLVRLQADKRYVMYTESAIDFYKCESCKTQYRID